MRAGTSRPIAASIAGVAIWKRRRLIQWHGTADCREQRPTLVALSRSRRQQQQHGEQEQRNTREADT
jgi:hypothetical protein